jgi:transcriptional regulator with XRE-family HTH domain
MTDPTRQDLSIGQRIARYRRNAGLTQDGLALRLFRSKSWVTKVERGERPIDSIRTLSEVARALGVQVRDLTGQPWFPEPGGPGHEAVPAIRRALTARSAPQTHPDGTPVVPRDPTILRRDVLDAGRLWQTEPACYSTVVPLLPKLLAESRLAAETGQGNGQVREATRTLTYLYQLLQEVMARLGEADLAWVAARGSLEAAERVGDRVLEAASMWRLCHAALRVNNLDEVPGLATETSRALRRSLEASAPASLTVYGGLQLVGAIAAVRNGDSAAADRFLTEAHRTAARLGEGRNDFWMTFGPTNVAIHDVEVLLERGDPARALRRAAAVDPDVLPSLERRSTHYVHLAHAYVLRRAATEATEALLQAERFNPEGLRYNMLARDLVRALLRRERQAAMPGLRGLARRLHLLT